MSGLTKRINNISQQLLLRCFHCYDGSDWTTVLPQVDFAYNATRALKVEHKPFEVNFGFSLEEPPDLLFNMRVFIFNVTAPNSDCIAQNSDFYNTTK
jgi:hypothetical protein